MGPGAPLQARPIDMGLPSGLQWASCNVGAEKQSDLGLYFSWGNVDGHGLDEGYDFSQAVYDATPAAAIAANLSLSQDAAQVILGAPWRMPSDAELQELVDNCTRVWTTQNGIPGLLFTSNVNGAKLFFPAAGYYDSSSLFRRDTYGYYWTSSFFSAASAHYLLFNSSSINPQSVNSRRLGFSIRAIYPPT